MLHTFRLCAFQDPPLANCHSILATTSSNLAAVLHLESWKMLSSNPCHVIIFSIHQGSEASGIKMCHSINYLTVSLLKKGCCSATKWLVKMQKKHMPYLAIPLPTSRLQFSFFNIQPYLVADSMLLPTSPGTCFLIQGGLKLQI